MIVSKVTYLLRKNLGDYQHEELSAEVTADIEKPESGEDMMREARRVCVQNTTAFLNKKKGEGNDKS